MPQLVINKQYQNETILTEEQLDAAFSSVMTFVNVTGLGADNIQDNSIGPAEIQTSAVTETKIATNAISTSKMQDQSVTLAKLSLALRQFLVPTASIQPYAGDSAPTGWLICDGGAYSRADYANLFSVVGVRFGSGDGTTTFNVPDLRGRFMRMVDGTAGRDPDSAARTAMNTGGATGNLIGSVQDDELKSHTHNVPGNGSPGVGWALEAVGRNSTYDTSNTGGNETRPKNANVNMIIKI